MKSFKLKIAVAMLFAGSASIIAQEESAKEHSFDLSLQLRPRTEYRNGAYRPLQKGEEPAILTNNRTRLTLDYANKDLLKVRLSLQNVNIWGQANQVQATDPTGGMSIYEAYADLKLGEQWNTKVGRQIISLDDERIFGALDWHPAGRSHDAVSVQWKNNKTQVQTFGAFNQNYKAENVNINNPAGQYFSPVDAQPYQHLQMLYAKHQFAPKAYVSFLANNIGYKNPAVEDGKVFNMQTFGVNYFGKHNKINAQASAYVQTGHSNSGQKKSAYLLSGSVGYQVMEPLNLTIGTDYLSGTANNDTSGKSKTFDPLYGTHHKFYGFMDYFYVGNPHGNGGLVDTYLKISASLNPKFNMGLDAHFFNSAAKVYNANEKLNSTLGSEIDWTFQYKIMPYATLVGGYSVFVDSSTLRFLKNTPNARNHQDWFWLSLNINPKIKF
ncbi:MAG: alginate export family protein [Cruoricaptor ignavus]|nr:alginate export family protein [Cruoricaptor ignavus]